MKKHLAGKMWQGLMWVGAVVLVCGAAVAWAQKTPPPPATAGTPVHMVVTVEARKGTTEPDIHRDDVMVYEGKVRDTVTDWVPLQGDQAPVELYLLIDDSSSSSLGTQLEDMRKFINEQPATTKVGVAYMQNGTAVILQNLTDDHAAAAKVVRLPEGIGGAEASPYFSLQDLIKRWPKTTARRAVMMVTDGIDRYYGAGDLLDPYLDAAIDDALRANVMVSAIYSPDAGHYGHSYWLTYWGQIYLSHLADETGGEAYYIGFNGPPVSFIPFLDEMEKRLGHQYLLTFVPRPEKKAGWQRVRLTTEVENADLVSARKVWVGGAR
jgi:hypothetical protein